MRKAMGTALGDKAEGVGKPLTQTLANKATEIAQKDGSPSSRWRTH